MKHCITLVSQNQGSGKSTGAVNIAASLAIAEKRVLLIDLDPKSNASQYLGYFRGDYHLDLCHFLQGNAELEQVVLPTELSTLHLLPSSPEIFELESDLLRRMDYANLFDRLDSLKDYDFVIFDCSSSLGLMTHQALNKANIILIPIKSDRNGLRDATFLSRTIDLIKKRDTHLDKKVCYLLNQFNPHESYSLEMLGEMEMLFKQDFFKIPIPQSRKIAEAASLGKPVVLYDIASAGAVAYMNLASSLLSHQPSIPNQAHSKNVKPFISSIEDDSLG